MGGRLGAKMEKAVRKDEMGPFLNQTVRGEDESVFDDEDPIIEDESAIMNKKQNPPKYMIEREPEREPDYSCLDGNITYSVLENENAMNGHR